jgi:DNA-binding MarR family transcriptional regulator
MSALASIERRGPLTPSELAGIERIQRPSATRILGGLIEAGLVVREPDASDRRSARVSVTRSGTAVLARGRARKTAYLARRLEALAPQDLQTLQDAAELIERLLEEEP